MSRWGVLIREAIDDRYPQRADVRREALMRVLAAEKMSVPDPGQLRDELEAIRSRQM
jgi:hypothetical protein